MAKDVVVFGLGSGSQMACRLLDVDSPYDVVGFVVDDAFLPETAPVGLPVVALSRVVSEFPPSQVRTFAPFGFQQMNGLRQEKYQDLKALGYQFISYVDSSNRLLQDVQIGENCLILDSQSFNYGVKIGNNVVIWSGCQLGDRSVIGDHAWLSAQVCVSGDVQVGERCFFGSNCTISHGVVVGDRCFIGANALIVKNTEPGAVHVVEGTPAVGMDSSQFVRFVRGG